MNDDWLQAPSLSESMIDMLDALNGLLELVAGHRAKAESLGFSSSIAEAMASALYAHLLTSAFNSSGPVPGGREEGGETGTGPERL